MIGPAETFAAFELTPELMNALRPPPRPSWPQMVMDMCRHELRLMLQDFDDRFRDVDRAGINLHRLTLHYINELDQLEITISIEDNRGRPPLYLRFALPAPDLEERRLSIPSLLEQLRAALRQAFPDVLHDFLRDRALRNARIAQAEHMANPALLVETRNMTATEFRQREYEILDELSLHREALWSAMRQIEQQTFGAFLYGGPLGTCRNREAADRALKLLKEWLSPEQRHQYEAKNYFTVRGCDTGRLYRIRHGSSMNIDEIDESGHKIFGWCFLPEGYLEAGDVMLAQKIALETDERKSLEVANKFGPHGGTIANEYARDTRGLSPARDALDAIADWTNDFGAFGSAVIRPEALVPLFTAGEIQPNAGPRVEGNRPDIPPAPIEPIHRPGTVYVGDFQRVRVAVGGGRRQGRTALGLVPHRPTPDPAPSIYEEDVREPVHPRSWMANWGQDMGRALTGRRDRDLPSRAARRASRRQTSR